MSFSSNVEVILREIDDGIKIFNSDLLALNHAVNLMDFYSDIALVAKQQLENFTKTAHVIETELMICLEKLENYADVVQNMEKFCRKSYKE